MVCAVSLAVGSFGYTVMEGADPPYYKVYTLALLNIGVRSGVRGLRRVDSGGTGVLLMALASWGL